MTKRKTIIQEQSIKLEFMQQQRQLTPGITLKKVTK